jgi:hypothetical protein
LALLISHVLAKTTPKRAQGRLIDATVVAKAGRDTKR